MRNINISNLCLRTSTNFQFFKGLFTGEYKSPNFLQTSEPPRMQWISLTNTLKLVYICANHFTPLLSNKGQFKAGFIKKFKLIDGSVPIVRDPDALLEVVSLTLYSIRIGFMIIC